MQRTSGGGVYLDGVSATLTGDTITGNTAAAAVGSPWRTGPTSSRVARWTATTAPVLSAAAVGSTSRILTRGLGEPQQRRRQHNTTVGDGGGLYVGNQSATSNNQVTLTNVTADNNSSDDAGGGLYVANDGAGGGTVTMTGGSVSGNSLG